MMMPLPLTAGTDSDTAVLKLHQSVSRCASAYQEAATAPLLHSSAQPHPALGHGGIALPHTQQLTTALLYSLREAVDSLTQRVAKLETLFFVLETERGRAVGGTSNSRTAPGASIDELRGLFSETVGPLRESIRQHERILTDVVQSLNHAAAWGYSNAAGTTGASPVGVAEAASRVPRAAAAGVPKTASLGPPASGKQSAFETPDRHDVGAAAVIVSPLTKAASQGATTVMEALSLDDVDTKHRIERLRHLARTVAADAPGEDVDTRRISEAAPAAGMGPAVQDLHHHRAPPNRERHRLAADVSSAPTTSLYTTTTTTASSSASSSTHIPLSRLPVPALSADDDDPLTSNTLLKNVQRIMHKSRHDDEVAEASSVEGNRARFLHNGADGRVVPSSSSQQESPQRKHEWRHTAAGEVDDSDSPSSFMHRTTDAIHVSQPFSLHRFDTDTTTTSTADLPHHGHYRRGVHELLTPESTRHAYREGGWGYHGQRLQKQQQDSSSLSDAYQEFVHRMRL